MAWVSRARLAALDRDHRTWPPSRIADYQLERVNALWSEATRTVPYYRDLLRERHLPACFDSLGQYVTLVPPLTKDAFRNRDVPCWRQKPGPDSERITGGSTAEPVQLPTWRKEYEENRLDPWLGRSWYGIRPDDRLLLYWGHSHLLGERWRGKINGWVRFAKDLAQNYRRHSSYDMTRTAFVGAGRRLLECGARFVIGYSCYLDGLARTNAGLASAFAGLRLKAVIGAAEGFPFEDSETRIAEVFGAPVGMEYGSVETGLVAHTHPDGGYRVFWNSYLLEFSPGSASQEVVVTSLFRRCTPLFRYRLHDRYELSDASRHVAGCSVLSFDRVIGRSNHFIRLPDGRRLHSEAVTHVVRGNPKITGYQFVSWKDRVTLNVTTREPMENAEIRSIRDAAGRIDSQFGEMLRIRDVPDLERTVAGKTPMILDRKEPSG